jgi:hypothetical protein
MQVPHVGQKLRYLAKVLVRIDLLQVGLRETVGVIVVVIVGSPSNDSTVSRYDFALDLGYPIVVLRDRKLICPGHIPEIEADFDDDCGVAAGVQRPYLRDALPRCDGPLQAALRLGDVSKEAHGIQQVRLPGCVGAYDERASTKRHVHAREVLPVLEVDAREQGKDGQ